MQEIQRLFFEKSASVNFRRCLNANNIDARLKVFKPDAAGIAFLLQDHPSGGVNDPDIVALLCFREGSVDIKNIADRVWK